MRPTIARRDAAFDTDALNAEDRESILPKAAKKPGRGARSLKEKLANWNLNATTRDVTQTKRLLANAVERWGVDLAFAAIKTMCASAFDLPIHLKGATEVVKWMNSAASASIDVGSGPELPEAPPFVLESARRVHLDEVYRRTSFGNELSLDELRVARRLQTAVVELQAAQAQAKVVLDGRETSDLSSAIVSRIVVGFRQHQHDDPPTPSELADLALLVGVDSVSATKPKRIERWKRALNRHSRKTRKKALTHPGPATVTIACDPGVAQGDGIAWWDPRTIASWKSSSNASSVAFLPKPSCCVPAKSQDSGALTMWVSFWNDESARATWKMVAHAGAPKVHGLWAKLVKATE